MQRLRFGLIWLITASLLGFQPCMATSLRFTLEDQAGDPRDNFDVVSVQVDFDTATGDYVIQATADPAHSFTGSHLLYLHAYNPDAPSTDVEDSLFSVTRFGFHTLTTTTMVQRAGNAPVLRGWKAGDRVATYDIYGLPPGVTGLQSVLGGTQQVFSNSDEINDTAVIVAVPEPSYIAAVLGAMPCMAALRRIQRQYIPSKS